MSDSFTQEAFLLNTLSANRLVSSLSWLPPLLRSKASLPKCYTVTLSGTAPINLSRPAEPPDTDVDRRLLRLTRYHSHHDGDERNHPHLSCVSVLLLFSSSSSLSLSLSSGCISSFAASPFGKTWKNLKLASDCLLSTEKLCFAAGLPTEQQPEGDSLLLLLLLPCDPTTAAATTSSPEQQDAVAFGTETGSGVKSWAAAECKKKTKQHKKKPVGGRNNCSTCSEASSDWLLQLPAAHSHGQEGVKNKRQAEFQPLASL